MRERTTTTRRTAVRTIASVTVGALGLSTASSATGDAPTDSCDASVDRIPDRVAVALTRHPNVYRATIDRIVDGVHVVLLLEDDGVLVDQHVAPRDELPDAEEGDALVVAISDGELRHALEIETNRGDQLQDRFDRLAEPLDG